MYFNEYRSVELFWNDIVVSSTSFALMFAKPTSESKTFTSLSLSAPDTWPAVAGTSHCQCSMVSRPRICASISATDNVMFSNATGSAGSPIGISKHFDWDGVVGSGPTVVLFLFLFCGGGGRQALGGRKSRFFL